MHTFKVLLLKVVLIVFGGEFTFRLLLGGKVRQRFLSGWNSRKTALTHLLLQIQMSVLVQITFFWRVVRLFGDLVRAIHLLRYWIICDGQSLVVACDLTKQIWAYLVVIYPPTLRVRRSYQRRQIHVRIRRLSFLFVSTAHSRGRLKHRRLWLFLGTWGPSFVEKCEIELVFVLGHARGNLARRLVIFSIV